MPEQVALPMAAVWDRLAASTPFRGPVMFSSDFINEMKVGCKGAGSGGLRVGGMWRCGILGGQGLRHMACCGTVGEATHASLVAGWLQVEWAPCELHLAHRFICACPPPSWWQGDYVLPSGVLGFEHLDVVPHKVGWGWDWSWVDAGKQTACVLAGVWCGASSAAGPTYREGPSAPRHSHFNSHPAPPYPPQPARSPRACPSSTCASTAPAATTLAPWCAAAVQLPSSTAMGPPAAAMRSAVQPLRSRRACRAAADCPLPTPPLPPAG